MLKKPLRLFELSAVLQPVKLFDYLGNVHGACARLRIGKTYVLRCVKAQTGSEYSALSMLSPQVYSITRRKMRRWHVATVENMRRTGYNHCMKNFLVKAFICAEAALYLAFTVMDVFDTGDSRWLKFAGIALCFVVSALLSAKGGEVLVTAAVGLSAAADILLLILDVHYAVGVMLFFAAADTVLRAYLSGKRTQKRVAAAAVYVHGRRCRNGSIRPAFAA